MKSVKGMNGLIVGAISIIVGIFDFNGCGWNWKQWRIS